MANLPPGDPKLVSLIVNHLKSQGLFDQFRRDCLADVDTKPAYQNLRQRVDNFVSNHLANHTWSPHLNKNQLRNNIRQQVLKSGMLESGIDRIISQVVDPKINHTFRPQVEKVVQEFLATLHGKEDANANHEQSEEKPESSVSVSGSMSAVGPSTSVANDAMSILETISSLNQEATAARALTENANHRNADKVSRKLLSQQSVDTTIEKERGLEEAPEIERPIPASPIKTDEPVVKQEELSDVLPPAEEIKNLVQEVGSCSQGKDIAGDSDEQRPKGQDRNGKKIEVSETAERKEEKKEIKTEKRNEHAKKSDDVAKQKDEKVVKEKEVEPEPVKHVAEKSSSKQKSADPVKEECPSIDSDLDAFSDVTVSSVHTSDLSSFEEESDEEDAVSDSTEEGEITSDDEEDKTGAQEKNKSAGEQTETKVKGTRHSYVHKPYLYSKYYSDSDDELTVEQRRQSVAKEKEERLLRRQMKRERLEEKRKQKAAERTKALKTKSPGVPSSISKSSKSQKPKSTSIKEVLKEQMFLEKKVALSKKKKKDLRTDNGSLKLKGELLDEDSRDTQKSNESTERASSSTRDTKSNSGRSDNKSFRKLLEPSEECKSESRAEKEFKKRGSSLVDKVQDTDPIDSRKPAERPDATSEEQQKSRSAVKVEKHSRKESYGGDAKNMPRKDSKSHRNERERTYSEDRVSSKQENRLSSKQDDRSSFKQDDRASSKHRHKTDSVHKPGSDEFDSQRSKRTSKDDDHSHKHSQSKSSSEERSDRKNKQKSESKSSTSIKGDKVSPHASKIEENVRRDSSKKERPQSTEKSRSEHRYKRSDSDTKPHRDSQSSSRSLSSSQKKSKSYTEDKNEADSNSDNSKQEDSSHKDKRRLHSFSEERTPVKAKFKSSSKSSKQNDQEDITQKSEKEKVLVEGYAEKHRKSKSEDKDSDERKDSTTEASSSTTKDANCKTKRLSDKGKERSQVDSRERSSSKADKKYSGDNSKSANSKNSHKDGRRKDDRSKSEERKHQDEKKAQDRYSSSERKSIKKPVSENRSEGSKGASARKGSRLDSESDRLCIATVSGEAKDADQPYDSKKIEKVLAGVSETIAAEVNVKDSPSGSNIDNTNPHTIAEPSTSKTSTVPKSNTKYESNDSKDNKSSSAFRGTLKVLPAVASSVLQDSNTAAAASAEREDEIQMTIPSSRNPTDNPKQSDSGIPVKKTRKSEYDDSDKDVYQRSGLENSSLEPLIAEHSSLSSDEIYSEVTDSNDGEISTSDLAEDGKKSRETIKKENTDLKAAIGFLERDNLVTGNVIEGEASVMETEYAINENNEQSIAHENCSIVEERHFVNISGTDRNVGSSIMDAGQGEPSSMANVCSRKDIQSRKEAERDDAATSSSHIIENMDDLRLPCEDTASSSNTTVDNTDKSCIEMDQVNLDNSRDYTSSASVDGNFVEDDGDFTMLSENSFEDATTSSSSDRKPCSEDHFLNPLLLSERRMETCSQSTTDVPEKHGSITLKAATSSSVNRGFSENAHETAASSSDNTEENAGFLNNVTHTATSSDTTADGSFAVSFITHLATSSESDGALGISANITTHTATSSSSTTESDGGHGNSERHTATSSSSMINSSRELNFEGIFVSSETDNENIAASSSNVMDSSTGDDSSDWLKNPSENDNAASSSSNMPTTRGNADTFRNIEDSKKTRATSSTQQDGLSEAGVNVISSGTPKEYPGNSSDFVMDSSTEVSVSVSSEPYPGGATSCSSSGGDRSLETGRYVEQSKEKDNTASSSSGGALVLTQAVGDEAASSSSSFMNHSAQHRLDTVMVNSDNTEAAASSSIATNSSTDQLYIPSACPENSTETAASSSSNSTQTRTYVDVNCNTLPTASSSFVMDSTEEDLNTRCVTETGRLETAATSSSALSGVCEEQTVPKDGVPASSSTMSAHGTKENVDCIVYADKLGEQAATSSDMMDSSMEDDKAFDGLSNHNAYATTSTSNNIDTGSAKDMDGCFNMSSDVNSEAAAASSSNAMESSMDNSNGDDSATSSYYMMDTNLEGVAVAHASCPSRNVEAASSSSYIEVGIQEIGTDDSAVRQTVDDATTSSSTERDSELIVFNIDEVQTNDTDNGTVEMAVESSVEANNGNTNVAGTSDEAAGLLSDIDANDDHNGRVERSSEDHLNEIGCEKTEEKEDTVSSASSEEQKHVCYTSRHDTRMIRDGETEGIVTSAGTRATSLSASRENSEVVGLASFEDKGIIDERNIGFQNPAEEATVSRTSNLNEDQVSETSIDNGASEDPDRDVLVENAPYEVISIADHDLTRPTNQPVLEEGEGAVTSTGITEENDGEKCLQVILRPDDSSCSGTETSESDSLQSRPETRDSRIITEDDESAITSTGAKEDEEEGEGFVTSTGTAGEDSSFSVSVEQSSSNVLDDIEKHSENKAVHHDRETNDQEVEETSNSDILESVTGFNLTQERSQNYSFDTTENECTPSPSEESSNLLTGVCASGSYVPNSPQVLEVQQHSSEQENKHDLKKMDFVFEKPHICLEENSTEVNDTVLGDEPSHLEVAQPTFQEENIMVSVSEFSSESITATEGKNVEYGKVPTVSENDSERAPTAVVDNIVDVPVGEPSTVCKVVSSDSELGRTSSCTENVLDESASEPKAPAEFSGTNENATSNQAEVPQGPTSEDVSELCSTVPYSDHAPLREHSPQAQPSDVDNCENKEKDQSVKVTESTEHRRPLQTEDSSSNTKDKKDEEKVEESERKMEEELKPKVEPEKRKRGRPPKKRRHSFFANLQAALEAKKGAGHPDAKQKQTKDTGNISKDDSNKEKNTTEVKNSAGGSGTSPSTGSRRGRKRKHPISSSETVAENLDPEKKRKKSESNEDQSEDNDEDSENDEDDHRGATTRAASRLEAQRKLPHKPTTRAASKLSSPEQSTKRPRKVKPQESKTGKAAKTRLATPQISGTKRRREASPPTTKTRDQHTSEDPPTKRIKRQ